MTGHDPLCPEASPPIPGEDPTGCWCYLIARARADERERIAQAIEATAVAPRGAVTAARFFALGTAARIAREGGPDVER